MEKHTAIQTNGQDSRLHSDVMSDMCVRFVHLLLHSLYAKIDLWIDQTLSTCFYDQPSSFSQSWSVTEYFRGHILGWKFTAEGTKWIGNLCVIGIWEGEIKKLTSNLSMFIWPRV